MLGVIALCAIVALVLVVIDTNNSDDNLADPDNELQELVERVELLGSAGYDLGTGIEAEIIPIVGDRSPTSPTSANPTDHNPFSPR